MDLHARVDRDLTSHPPGPEQGLRMDRLRAEAKDFAHLVVDLVPPGREQSSALTKIEEALFHANAGVAREAAGDAQGPPR